MRWRRGSSSMANVPREGTKSEIRVRRAMLERGVRGFECNASDLPGSPDVILRSAKRAIFVNGCFWHLHPGCSGAWIPTHGRSKPYWTEKLIRNALRDQRAERELAA